MKVRWATWFKRRPRNTVLAYEMVALHVQDDNFCGWNLNIGVWSEKASHVEQQRRGRQTS